MNITAYPYHLTERQLKLCHVRDPSTDTGEIRQQSQSQLTCSARAVDPALPFETYKEILFDTLGSAQVTRRCGSVYLGVVVLGVFEHAR